MSCVEQEERVVEKSRCGGEEGKKPAYEVREEPSSRPEEISLIVSCSRSDVKDVVSHKHD